MVFWVNCVAQPGTRARPQDVGARRRALYALMSLLALGLGAGCTDSSALSPDASEVDARNETPAARRDGGEPDAESEPHQSHDTGGPDAGDAAAPDSEQPHPCLEHARAIQAFVAAHRRCETHADCVIVGDCSHADFQAVAREFEAEAKDLVFDDAACGAFDGPTYHAVCRAGSCERVQSVHACGYAISQFECPSDTARYEGNTCGYPPALRAGCYQACDADGDDASCAAGFTCQQTSVNPCPSSDLGGAPTCDACGAAARLCLPAPACQVELSLAFNGSTAARVFTGRSAELQLWLENRTDETITFDFEVPCHGPRIQGLGDFDLWQACLAGACLEEPLRTELTLAPHERRLWRSAVLDLEPSDCNPQGLPSGMYTPTFTLTNVQGAITCGPAPASLLTGSEARP
jgi:hypothetical protein